MWSTPAPTAEGAGNGAVPTSRRDNEKQIQCRLEFRQGEQENSQGGRWQEFLGQKSEFLRANRKVLAVEVERAAKSGRGCAGEYENGHPGKERWPTGFTFLMMNKEKWSGRRFHRVSHGPTKSDSRARHSVCLSSDVQGCTVAAASRMGELRGSFYVSNRESPTWSPGLGHNHPSCASSGQCGRER